jgi:hypothetical protein
MLTWTLPLFGGGGEPFSEGAVSELLHAELMTAGRHNHATDQSRERFHNAMNIRALLKAEIRGNEMAAACGPAPQE